MTISKKIQFTLMAFAVAAMSSNIQAQKSSRRGDSSRGRGGSQSESRGSSQSGGLSRGSSAIQRGASSRGSSAVQRIGSSSGASRTKSDRSGSSKSPIGPSSRLRSSATSRAQSERSGSTRSLSGTTSKSQSDRSGNTRSSSGASSRFQIGGSGIQIQRNSSGGFTLQRGNSDNRDQRTTSGSRDQRPTSGSRDQRENARDRDANRGSDLRIQRDSRGGITIGRSKDGGNRDQRGASDHRDHQHHQDRGDDRGRRSSDVSDALQDLRSRILNSRSSSNSGNRDSHSRFDGRHDSNHDHHNHNSGRTGTIYRGGSYYRSGHNNPGITIGGRNGIHLSIGQSNFNRSHISRRYGGRSGWSHFMPRYGNNRGGAFYCSQNQYYYSPNYYSQSVYSQPLYSQSLYSQGTIYQQPSVQQSQEPVQIEFGQRRYVAELADQLQVLSNELCLDLYENYSGNPNFKATYTDAYAVLSFAKYLQAEGNNVPQTQLIEEMSGIDSLFHEVEETVATWTPQQRKKISELDTPTRLEFIEETIHHLMYDIGVPVEDVNHNEGSIQ